MRIGFVISSLQAGGAQRVASLLCEEWSRDPGANVRLFSFEPVGAQEHFPLPPGVAKVDLDLHRQQSGLFAYVRDNISRVGKLRSALKSFQPDVVVAFLTETNLIVSAASIGMPWRVFFGERTHPAFNRGGGIFRLLRRFLYRRGVLVVQSEEVRGWYQELGLDSQVIGNPVQLSTFTPAAYNTDWSTPKLMAIGRMVPAKGFDILLRAAAMLRDRGQVFTLHIIGDGPERGRLEGIVRDHNLESQVHLSGLSADARVTLDQADILVNASLYEGFPNVVLEGMAAGCAIVATDSPGGTRDLLDGGRAGMLVRVGDAQALADGLWNSIHDQAARSERQNYAASWIRQYDLPVIAARWRAMFEQGRVA